MLTDIVISSSIVYKVNNKLIKLNGFNRTVLRGYDYKGKWYSWEEEEFKKLATKTDLTDYPENENFDPQLPYDFDLHWDVKRPSEVNEDHWLDADFLELARNHKDVPTKCIINSPLYDFLFKAGRDYTLV